MCSNCASIRTSRPEALSRSKNRSAFVHLIRDQLRLHSDRDTVTVRRDRAASSPRCPRRPAPARPAGARSRSPIPNSAPIRRMASSMSSQPAGVESFVARRAAPVPGRAPAPAPAWPAAACRWSSRPSVGLAPRRDRRTTRRARRPARGHRRGQPDGPRHLYDELGRQTSGGTDHAQGHVPTRSRSAGPSVAASRVEHADRPLRRRSPGPAGSSAASTCRLRSHRPPVTPAARRWSAPRRPSPNRTTSSTSRSGATTGPARWGGPCTRA